jgi:hypothetical protein
VEVVDNFNCNSNNTYLTKSSMFVGFSSCPSSFFSVEHYRTPNRPVFHPLNALALVAFFRDTTQFHLLEFRASLLQKTCADKIYQHNRIKNERVQ